MPYLNLDLDFFDHRKTRRLVLALGRGSEALLIRLWCYVARHHAEHGRLTDYSPGEIETLAGWIGKPGRFIEAMTLSGFMERTDSGWSLKNWLEHQGHIAAFRARGKAMAEARWSKARGAPSNATRIAARNAPTVPTELTDPEERETGARPKLEEVLTECQMRCYPEAEGQRFWDHFESSGWIDKNGNPVLVWRSKLRTWIANARALPAEAAHHGKEGRANGVSPNVQAITDGKELDRVEKRMDRIKASYADNQSWSASDNTEFQRLKARRKELKARLGMMI